MSKIASITAAANASGLKAEYATGKLEVQISASSAAQTFAAFLTSLATLQLEVNKQTKNGTITVLQRTNVLDLFESAQANGGLIEGTDDGAHNFKLKSAIELTDFGAIALTNGEFFEVNFFNFPVSAGVVYNIDVFALDNGELTNIHNVYEKQYLNADSAREIDVRDAKTLVIPFSLFSKIELLYYNGRRVNYTIEEMGAIMRDGIKDGVVVRSIVHTPTGALVNSIQNNLIFNVGKVISVKLTTTDATNIILVKHQTI